MECLVSGVPCLVFIKVLLFWNICMKFSSLLSPCQQRGSRVGERGGHSTGRRHSRMSHVTYVACCVGTSMSTQTWRTPGFITEIFLNEQREHSRRKEQENGRCCNVLCRDAFSWRCLLSWLMFQETCLSMGKSRPWPGPGVRPGIASFKQVEERKPQGFRILSISELQTSKHYFLSPEYSPECSKTCSTVFLTNSLIRVFILVFDFVCLCFLLHFFILFWNGS